MGRLPPAPPPPAPCPSHMLLVGPRCSGTRRDRISIRSAVVCCSSCSVGSLGPAGPAVLPAAREVQGERTGACEEWEKGVGLERQLERRGTQGDQPAGSSMRFDDGG